MSAVNEQQPEWPLRRAKAAATRLAVIEAARRCFVEAGYAGATVQAIADAAGVSRATVFNAVGGKAALLKAAYDVATVGDDEPVPLPQRPAAVATRLEPDPRRAIAIYAGMIADIGERLAPDLRGLPRRQPQRPRGPRALAGDPAGAAEGGPRLRRDHRRQGPAPTGPRRGGGRRRRLGPDGREPLPPAGDRAGVAEGAVPRLAAGSLRGAAAAGLTLSAAPNQSGPVGGRPVDVSSPPARSGPATC